MTTQQHISQANLIAALPYEILVLFNRLPTNDKEIMLNYWEYHLSKERPDFKGIYEGVRLVKAISRIEIPSTTEITNLGATLALFQGQMRDFFILTNPKTNLNNPEIYNNLALFTLLFKGQPKIALNWLQKINDLESKEENNQNSISVIIPQKTKLFSCILSSYAYNLLDDIKNARIASNKINSFLNKLEPDVFHIIHFWHWYFQVELDIIKRSWDNAIRSTEEAVKVAKRYNHHIFLGLALQLKGRVLKGRGRRGEHIPAYVAFRDAKSLFEKSNSVFLISLYSNLGDLEKIAGRYTKAHENYQKTISYTLGINKIPFIQLSGLKGLADLYLLQGSYQLAQDAYERAIKIATLAQSVPLEAACLTALGCLFSDQKDYNKAQQHLQKSLDLREKYHLNKIYTLLELGKVFVKWKKIALARTYYNVFRRQKIPALIELNLFNSFILMTEEKLNESRNLLEKTQFSYAGNINEFEFKVRNQLALAHITILEIIEEDDKSLIDEVVDRINKIRPMIDKPAYPSLQVLLLLIDTILEFLDSMNRKKSLKVVLKAIRLARQSNLRKIEIRAELFKRRFSRKQVKIEYSHLIDLFVDMERSIIYLSQKILE